MDNTTNVFTLLSGPSIIIASSVSLPTKYAKNTLAIPKEIIKKINHFSMRFLIFSAFHS